MGTLELEKTKGHNNNWERGKGPNDVVVRRVKEQNERPHYSAEARNSMAASKRDAPPMYNHYAEYCIT